MRTPKAREYLVDHYRNDETRGIATMFLGAPGIGKTQAGVEAAQIIADELDRELVIYTDQEGHRIRDSKEDNYFVYTSVPLVCHQPYDFTGIPRSGNSNGESLIEFKPLLWAKVASEHPGMIVLDDFLDVQRPDLFSVAYKITLERRVGYHELHDGQMVVCASNTPEESSLSQMMPAPLANRMIILDITPPTVNEWGNWMQANYGDEWDRRTLAFLKRFEDEGYLLQVPSETEVLKNFPTPRTWTKASLKLRQTDDPEVLDGLLGPVVGQKFHAFTQVRVDVSELIRKPSLWDDQTLDGKYMLAIELATWFRKAEKPEEGFELLDQMSEESRQFPILVFLSINWKELSELLNTLFKHESKYSDLVSQAIEDREAISI